MTGPPVPRLATNAVGIPATPRSMLKPLPSRYPASRSLLRVSR